MRILIDADGCPVVDETLQLGKEYGVECLILCDTAHIIQKSGAQTLTFPTGADSVDFALVNMLSPGDLVITQDYGLAAMCLARRALILNQYGMEYTQDNIDSLLHLRDAVKKIVRGGGRVKGPAKRTAVHDRAFEEALRRILDRELKEERKN